MENQVVGVKNPSIAKNRAWIYNIFLGNALKNDKGIKHHKVNWVMELNNYQIEQLEEIGCEVFQFENNSSKGDSFKKGFEALLSLFNELMKEDPIVKEKIRSKLFNSETNKIDNRYTIIQETKKSLNK